MWTNIFLSLWIIGTVKHKMIPIPRDCARRVQRCPVEKVQWEEKNDQLNCTTPLGYVCLRDADGYLFETCMANFKIQANSSNCPILYDCHENIPYLGKDTTYYYCPENVSGCPPRNHAGYKIHQLYKYPLCLESNISEENGYRSTITTSHRFIDASSDHVQGQEEMIAVSVIVASVVALTVLGRIISLVLQRRNRTTGFIVNNAENYMHLRRILV